MSNAPISDAVRDLTNFYAAHVQPMAALIEALKPLAADEVLVTNAKDQFDIVQAKIAAAANDLATLNTAIADRQQILSTVNTRITFDEDARKQSVDRDLANYRASVATTMTQLNQQVDAARQTIHDMDTIITARTTTIHTLDDEIASRQSTIASLKSDAAAVIAKLQSAAGDTHAPAAQ